MFSAKDTNGLDERKILEAQTPEINSKSSIEVDSQCVFPPLSLSYTNCLSDADAAGLLLALSTHCLLITQHGEL